jgi:hypothetical protein
MFDHGWLVLNFSTKQTYRVLLLLLVLLTVLASAARMEISFTPELLEILSGIPESKFRKDFFMLFAVLLAGLAMIAFMIYGLWRYRVWARTYFTFLCIFIPFSHLFFEALVMNGVEAFFSQMSLIVAGILLGMMHFSEVRNLFVSSRKRQPQQSRDKEVGSGPCYSPKKPESQGYGET